MDILRKATLANALLRLKWLHMAGMSGGSFDGHEAQTPRQAEPLRARMEHAEHDKKCVRRQTT